MNEITTQQQVSIEPAESKSALQRLMQQIDAEIAASKLAIYGFVQGNARHAFINERMDRIGGYQEQLQALIGDDALPVIIAKIDQLAEE
jgi:hypothetical protein